MKLPFALAKTIFEKQLTEMDYEFHIVHFSQVENFYNAELKVKFLFEKENKLGADYWNHACNEWEDCDQDKLDFGENSAKCSSLLIPKSVSLSTE